LVPAAIVPVNVPPSEPLPVLSERLTPVALTTFVGVPLADCDCTTTGKPTPAVGLEPPLTDTTANFEATPALIVNELLVAPVRPLDETVTVYPVPTLSIDRSVKLATPDDAFLLVVPLSVPPPGFVPIATVIEAAAD